MTPLTRINIISFTGGSDGADLVEQCHFVETGLEEFLFHAPGNSPIRIVNGETFNFITPQGLNWTITFYYSDFTRRGQGDWKVTKPGSQDDPESGTFQAQAGPGAEDDLSASASASA